MSESFRRRAALAVFIVASAALVATSQIEDTVSGTLNGAVTVAPDAPGRFDARFVFDPPGEATIAGFDIRIVVKDSDDDVWPDSRIAGSFAALVEGSGEYAADHDRIAIPPAECENGCAVDVIGDLTWQGDRELPLVVPWEVNFTIHGPTACRERSQRGSWPASGHRRRSSRGWRWADSEASSRES